MASSIMVKRIIIIGATSGIGYEVAKIYWKRGYQLGLAGRRVDRLEEFRRQDPEHIRIKKRRSSEVPAPQKTKHAEGPGRKEQKKYAVRR